MKKILLFIFSLLLLVSCVKKEINNEIKEDKKNNTNVIINNISYSTNDDSLYSDLIFVDRQYNINNKFEALSKIKCSIFPSIIKREDCFRMKYSLVKFFKKKCSDLIYKEEKNKCLSFSFGKNIKNISKKESCDNIFNIYEKKLCIKNKQKINSCNDLTNQKDKAFCLKNGFK